MNNDYVHATQWAFNPSVYQNMSNDEVDWATLAQQWIKMKETCPQMTASITAPPPPPPPIGAVNTVAPSKDPNVEEGEAPMDMDNGKDDPESSTSSIPAIGNNQNWNQWNNWNQWGWGWGQVDPKSAPASMDVPNYVVSNTPAPFAAPASEIVPPSQNYNQDYWPSNSEPYTKSKHNDWSEHHSGPRRGRRRSRDRERREETVVHEPEILDAAKRKQLPAWIREGLEKMEREKQKKLEQEQMKQERERYSNEKKDRDLFLNQSNNPLIPAKSKFESDSESDEEENGRSNTVELRKSRFDQAAIEKSSYVSLSEDLPVKKSKEQIMEETMLKVRRVLTQILMEVTTQEMETVVNQVHSVLHKKAPALRNQKTPQLTSVTSRLGLGIYDSESGSSSESEDNFKQDGEESDSELKERIMRKKRDFQKIERDIESRIEEEEEKERRLLAQEESDYSESESYNNDDEGDVDNNDDNLANKKGDEVEFSSQHLRLDDAIPKGQVPHSHQLSGVHQEKSVVAPENAAHNNLSHSKREPSEAPSLKTTKSSSRSSVDSDESSSSDSKSSSYSSSSSSDSKHSKLKLKQSKKEGKSYSSSRRRSRSRSKHKHSEPRRSRRPSMESRTSSSSKRRKERSSSEESRSARYKKAKYSSEKRKKQSSYSSKSRNSDSPDRKKYRNSRSPSRDKHKKSTSPSSHRSSVRSHHSRSSHSRYSRSPSYKYTHARPSRNDKKSKRSRRSASSSDSYSSRPKSKKQGRK